MKLKLKLIATLVVLLISAVPTPAKADKGPIWFGVNCSWYWSPNVGYAQIKWDFPPGKWKPDKNKPGVLMITYGRDTTYYKLSLLNEDVTLLWGAIWKPKWGKTAKVQAYVKRKGGGQIWLPEIEVRCAHRNR